MLSPTIRINISTLGPIILGPKLIKKISKHATRSAYFATTRRIQGAETNVWNAYKALEMKYQPLNLGPGHPDEAPPKFITEALIRATNNNDPNAHQYARGFGHVRFVKAIGEFLSYLIERPIDPLNEVLVTIGADEAIFASIMSLVDKGDEVIIIEPFYDFYEPIVKMAGGIPRFIPLRALKNTDTLTAADFHIDDKELESIFNKKTKMIIINTPHNPVGKVFKRDELEKIASLCRKWNVICLSDEVYEFMVHDGNEHVRICTLSGMWERTVTIGSAVKTFSVTGWKTGWAYGPANLIANLRMIHQNCVYTCPTPIQEALAICFEHEIMCLGSPESYLNNLARVLPLKRDILAKLLVEAGMNPIIPEGGCFVLTDWSPLANKIDLTPENDKYMDLKFTKWMIKNIGLQAIPPSAFYGEANKHLGEKYVRFSFCKSLSTLEKAAEILKNWQHLNKSIACFGP